MHINQLKANVASCLTTYVFQHIYDELQEGYLDLAAENACLQKKAVTAFLYKGEVYPKQTRLSRHVAPLHPTLHSKFHKLNTKLEEAGYTTVKNFLSVVINASAHNIVLTALLPSVLVENLKEMLTPEEFNAVNLGSFAPPLLRLQVTQKHIASIKEGHKEGAKKLREVMMTNLLLR